MRWKVVRDNSGCVNVLTEEGESLMRDISEDVAREVVEAHNAKVETQ